VVDALVFIPPIDVVTGIVFVIALEVPLLANVSPSFCDRILDGRDLVLLALVLELALVVGLLHCSIEQAVSRVDAIFFDPNLPDVWAISSTVVLAELPDTPVPLALPLVER